MRLSIVPETSTSGEKGTALREVLSGVIKERYKQNIGSDAVRPINSYCCQRNSDMSIRRCLLLSIRRAIHAMMICWFSRVHTGGIVVQGRRRDKVVERLEVTSLSLR